MHQRKKNYRITFKPLQIPLSRDMKTVEAGPVIYLLVMEEKGSEIDAPLFVVVLSSKNLMLSLSQIELVRDHDVKV